MRKLGYLLLLLGFLLPSCIDSGGLDDDDDDDDEGEQTEETNPWINMGKIDGSESGWGFYFDARLVVDDNGVAYVFYSPQYSSQGGGNGYVATFDKADGYTPSTFTGAVFGTFDRIQAAIYNNVPYVAFFDYSNGTSYVAVTKKEGGVWNEINQVLDNSFADDDFDFVIGKNGALWIAYNETLNQFDASGRVTVKKYENGAWSFVGSRMFSDSLSSNIQIAVDDNNKPWVLYREVGSKDKKGQKYLLEHFNGSAWERKGYLSQSASIDHISMAVANGKPHIAFSDGQPSVTKKGFVKYWDGSSFKSYWESEYYQYRTKLAYYNGKLYMASKSDAMGGIVAGVFESGTLKPFATDILSNHVTGLYDFQLFVNAKGVFIYDEDTQRLAKFPF